MRKLTREDILDLKTYARERDRMRASVMSTKSRRRVHLGDNLTFLFENFETMRDQVHEMLRIEKQSDEAAIAHEIETYNDLLAPDGALSCTLLIEIEDPVERDAKLREWRDLPKYVWLELENGARCEATFDPRQVGEDRLSSVQYLKFACDGVAPIAVGCSHPALELRAELTPVQRKALAEDL